MPLEKAIAVTLKLKAALAAEVSNARAQRELFHSFDGERLLEMAVQRENFNHQTAHLQQQLAEALAESGRQFRLATVTLDALTSVSPEEGGRLREELGQIRALAATLSELDQMNQHLAERALSCVRAYTQYVQPAVTAYDKRGLHALQASSTRSQRL